MTHVKKLLFLAIFLLPQLSGAAVWQWAVPVKGAVSSETQAAPRAFLWIPENCRQVRGVVVGQHNMSEEGILEHPEFRNGMSQLGFAEVWVTPGFAMTFDFHDGAGEVFEQMMLDLADVSGYQELAYAPVVPMGHSAYASYPWNFGAWNPARTLAMLSIHGDAPQTHLTGSGQPNPEWNGRHLEGIPGLMVIGEYEWWLERVQPAMEYRMKYPDAPISLLVDAGHGHFDVSDELVSYLVDFLKKTVQYRLPKKRSLEKAPQLKPVDPMNGWLKERWRQDSIPLTKAAPYTKYHGDKGEAFWYFDQEMVRKTETYYQESRGKKEQFLGFAQQGKLLVYHPNHHARFVGDFEPESDGLTFHLKAVKTNASRTEIANQAPGKPEIERICGPVEKINDTTFRVKFYRMGLNNPKRTGDIWLLARHPGNAEYKSAVQQFNMRIPYPLKTGNPQTIDFPEIKDQKVGVESFQLEGTTSSGLPVQFYVREGPAEIKDGKLYFTPIPQKVSFRFK